MATPCANPIGGFTPASTVVPQQFDFFTEKVNEYLRNANQFSQVLANYNIEPLISQPVEWAVDAQFTPFDPPEPPEDFADPGRRYPTTPPPSPSNGPINTSGLNVSPPTLTLPPSPTLSIPTPPSVNLPAAPDAAPTLGDTEIPTYTGGPLPEVPTLYALNLPSAPDINLDELNVERPQFIPPNGLLDVYRSDFDAYSDIIWTGVDGKVTATGVTDMHARLQAMLAGGTGLPANIEQALFDRAINRDEVSSLQAVAQATQEWAARGFTLPGSTLLARVQEIREANRKERGRINREISIQFHTQEIENLRFAVQQAIGLEGQLLQAHTQIYEVARTLADGHWVVAKGIYDSQLDTFRLQLEIYRTDVEVYKESIQIELAKLEVYRSQLEGQRLIGTLNQQLVDIYNAELQGVLANVEVFRAQVQGAEAQIRAEVSKIEAYKARIDAYTAQIQGERAKYDIYSAQVGAEEVKARVYAEQVDAYGKRIDAYRTQVDAEATKVQARIGVAEADARIYAEEVRAWQAGIQADTANLQSFVEVYRAQLTKYTSMLEAEQYRVTGESRNFELEIERERARVAADLQASEQAIEQLKHITNLGLAATDTAAKVNAQLAASAMAAINVSAGMTTTNSLSAQDNRSCSTQYSATLSV